MIQHLKIVIFWLALMIMMLPKGAFQRFIRGLKKEGEEENRDWEGESSGSSDNSAHLWESRFQNIPLKFYGGGADKNFDHYFTGQSEVSVSTIDEIVEWLLGCEYVSDPELFNKRDHWQHPIEFEKSRKGDCEDFALWAWRKLVELGHDAEFMVGKWLHDDRVGTHAWVFLRYQGEQIVFESTGRAPERIIKEHQDVMDNYVPFASVDNELRKKVYNGITHWIMTKM